ncbi:O-antigen ligase family protein [Calothrix sp. NIES-3974]|uniref:O-antigen ligase family protein n=1 Tax=Calothrix sp. NIES-3974 TaxID=2005462 RepID=UPI000B5FE859|nr:O-antigen ligase family protein [Calothrix sp. NIES-3974]BAZ06894.1 O-antigen polymerase [Calothrix sp. NIES-3974]
MTINMKGHYLQNSTSSNQENKLIFYYHVILAVTFVLTFFTNFDVYFSHAIGTPQPKVWVGFFGVASIPLLFSLSSRLKYISKTLLFWIYVYIFISVYSYIFYSHYQPIESEEELRTRILSIIFLFISSLIFSSYQVQKIVKYEILLITLVNVIANICSLLYPESFVTVFDHQSVLETNRAAGFYIDSNRATCVLILGMIFTIDIVPVKFRLPFIILLFIGAFVTFSRSGFICFFLVTAIFIYWRKILLNNKNISWLILACLLIWMFFNSIVLNSSGINVQENLLDNPNFERITQINPMVGKSEIDDVSSSRLPIAEKTWQEFLESPFWGRGIGYGLKLESNVIGKRSHNMYLSFMLEHGFLGSLVLPLLVFCCVCNSAESNFAISFAFVILILVWSFFSHNVLEHREFLMSFSLMSSISLTAEMPVRSKVISKKNFQNSL